MRNSGDGAARAECAWGRIARRFGGGGKGQFKEPKRQIAKGPKEEGGDAGILSGAGETRTKGEFKETKGHLKEAKGQIFKGPKEEGGDAEFSSGAREEKGAKDQILQAPREERSDEELWGECGVRLDDDWSWEAWKGGGMGCGVRGYEELLERVPRAEWDGRYAMRGAREVLGRYWDLLLLLNRRPTRAECDAWLPRWRGFFRSFRELEAVTWRTKGERFGRRMGLPREGGVMSREVVNEQGVVLVFGAMARELGFVVETIGTSYPDCVARRESDGARVRIEFEYSSGRFDHDPAGCDLVVCWVHDWKECRCG